MDLIRKELIEKFEKITKNLQFDNNRVTDIKDLTFIDCDYILDALKYSEMMAERLENRPLYIYDMRNMNGEEVYCLELNMNVTIHAETTGFITVSYKTPSKTCYGVQISDLTLYKIID